MIIFVLKNIIYVSEDPNLFEKLRFNKIEPNKIPIELKNSYKVYCKINFKCNQCGNVYHKNNLITLKPSLCIKCKTKTKRLK